MPDNLSVAGYNDVELARSPGLTTVRVPMRELVGRGGELLAQRVSRRTFPVSRV